MPWGLLRPPRPGSNNARGVARRRASTNEDEQRLEDARCSALGNTFHIPSVMLFLALLLNLPHVPGAIDCRALPPGSWSSLHAPLGVYPGSGEGWILHGLRDKLSLSVLFAALQHNILFLLPLPSYALDSLAYFVAFLCAFY